MSHFFKKSMLSFLLIGVLASCGSDSDSSGTTSTSDTYSISGSMSVGSSSKSLNIEKNLDSILKATGEKTACPDGSFYGVYCVSFTTPPVAAEGNVDCTNGGAFTVDGLPKGEPIGCFVRRYESASSTDATTVGSVEIPASNLNGSTDTIIAAGDVDLNINVNEQGTITASVVSGEVNSDPVSVPSNFTAENINGVWTLSCSSDAGGNDFSSGRCKCFLGEQYFQTAGYFDERDCLEDPQGPGAAITDMVEMGIGIYVYGATTQSVLPMEGGVEVPANTELSAISIWGTSGSSGNYVSAKGAGGEGVTSLDGALAWDTTNGDPTADIAWATGSVTIQDFSQVRADITFTLPANINFNTATHGQYVTWIRAVANAADSAGFSCFSGPSDAAAFDQGSGPLGENLACSREVFDALSQARIQLPRVDIVPYCGQTGCFESVDTSDNPSVRAGDYYNANSWNMARIYVDGIDHDYPEQWSSSDDNTNVAVKSDGSIGAEPENRFVFEPLELFPGGAGFRQSEQDHERYPCFGAQSSKRVQNSGGIVENATCDDFQNFYELECFSNDNLSIKFLGDSAPYDVLFEQTEVIVGGILWQYGQNGPTVVEPTGTSELALCKQATDSGKSATFFATGTKQAAVSAR